jgi:hypothetical protein
MEWTSSCVNQAKRAPAMHEYWQHLTSSTYLFESVFMCILLMLLLFLKNCFKYIR